MNRRTDLITAFFFALALHCISGICAGNLLGLHPGRIMPIFKEGESSVRLTLLPTPKPVRPPQDKPEAGQPALAAIPKKQDRSHEERPSEKDADILEKGVKTLSFSGTELRPRYPLSSRLRGEEGLVTVKAEINANGRAEKTKVTASSGYRALDRAAVDAFSKARFVVRSGISTGGREVVLSFHFKLIE